MAGHFRELIGWQKAVELVTLVYRLTESLPEAEQFGLSSQMRRAAVSIPNNIAEGHERRSRKDYRRFVVIACGSSAELETLFDICNKPGFAENERRSEAIRILNEVGRMLRAIGRSLSKQIDVP